MENPWEMGTYEWFLTDLHFIYAAIFLHQAAEISPSSVQYCFMLMGIMRVVSRSLQL